MTRYRRFVIEHSRGTINDFMWWGFWALVAVWVALFVTFWIVWFTR